MANVYPPLACEPREVDPLIPVTQRKGLNRGRLQAGWVLMALIILVAASPSPGWQWAGSGFVVLGLLTRLLAAATLIKNASLTTTGMYQVVRHPLYLGNALVGTGFGCFGGHWLWVALWLIFFALIYRELILAEEATLGQRYPETFPHFQATVPLWVPNLRKLAALRGHCSLARLKGNREWRNQAAILLGLGVVLIKAAVLAPGTYWWTR